MGVLNEKRCKGCLPAIHKITMMVKYVFFQIFQKEGKLIKVSTAFSRVGSLLTASTPWSDAFKVYMTTTNVAESLCNNTSILTMRYCTTEDVFPICESIFVNPVVNIFCTPVNTESISVIISPEAVRENEISPRRLRTDGMVLANDDL